MVSGRSAFLVGVALTFTAFVATAGDSTRAWLSATPSHPRGEEESSRPSDVLPNSGNVAMKMSVDDDVDEVASPATRERDGEKTSALRIRSLVSTTLPPNVTLPSNAARSRYLTANPLYGWYGLTNQMIAHAAMLRYGMDDGRAVLFPVANSSVVSFYEVFDASSTQSCLGNLVRIVRPRKYPRHPGGSQSPARLCPLPMPSNREARPVIAVDSDRHEADNDDDVAIALLSPPQSMNKKHLWLPTRDVYRGKPNVVADGLKLVETIQRKSKRFAFVRHHNFFFRFPWAASHRPFDEAFFIAALQPSPLVRRFSEKLYELIGQRLGLSTPQIEGHSRMLPGLVALHLRLEKDAKLIRSDRAKMPSSDQVFEVFDQVKRQFGTTCRGVYLCLGTPLPNNVASAVDAWNQHDKRSGGGFPIVHRASVVMGHEAELPVLPQSVGQQRNAHAKAGVGQTQDHYASFVDLSVLEASEVAIVTHFSSLKVSVFARRCAYIAIQAETSSLRAAVHTIDFGLDGTPRKLAEFPCSEASQSGWAGHRSWT